MPIKGDLYGVLEVREKSKRRALPGRLAEIASAKEVRLEAGIADIGLTGARISLAL